MAKSVEQILAETAKKPADSARTETIVTDLTNFVTAEKSDHVLADLAKSQADFTESQKAVDPSHATVSTRVRVIVPQVPSLGRIVHYQASHNRTYAAIICDVINEQVVSLTVFNKEGGSFGLERVRFGDGVHEWSWPPRV